jgi:hypothetical protein
MPIPNLTRSNKAVLHSSGQGAPINGNQSFDIGIPADKIVDDRLVIDVFPLGPSVTAASYVGRVGSVVTMNFAQAGADQVRIQARMEHSAIW